MLEILIYRLFRIDSRIAEFRAVMTENYNFSGNFLKYFQTKIKPFGGLTNKISSLKMIG